MATIKDVAREAGVSITLVSRHINGKKGVGMDAAARIASAIERLEYQPNQLARSLVQGQTYLLGILMDTLSNPQYFPFIEGVEEAAAREGYEAVFLSGGGVPERKTKLFSDFTKGRVDGVIVLGGLDVGALKSQNPTMPMVLVENEIPGLQTDVVVFDNQEAAYQLTRHLLQRKRWVCHFAAGSGSTACAERMEGYSRAVRELLDADHIHIVDCGYLQENGHDTLKRLAGKGILPEAILASSDAAAYGVIQALLELGKRVPDDVVVAGFGGGAQPPAASYPTLTTVVQPLREMGAESVARLLRRIKEPGLLLERKLFHPQLVLRRSSRA